MPSPTLRVVFRERAAPWRFGHSRLGAVGPAHFDLCRGTGNDPDNHGPWKSADDAERRRRHSHAERGNEYNMLCLHGWNLGGVCNPSENRCNTQ